MDHIHDFYDGGVFKNTVHHDEWKRWQNQFSSIFHAANPTAIWKVSKHAETIIDQTADALRSHRVVQTDVVNYVVQVRCRVRRPANLHLPPEPPFKTDPDFVMGKKFAAVEPTQARGYLLPKPRIVIQIAFYELLHVVIRLAAIFSGNT